MSLKFIMDQLKPYIVVIQETKLKKKSLQLKGYKCFPTVRGDSGGGLLVACLASLDPVIVFEGDSECEILVVHISLKQKEIRIIAGYGPQECAPVLVRETYRNTVEEQVVRANLAGASVIIAEDANAKLGPDWVENDPNPISENGKLLAKMIVRQELKIVNVSNKCVGGPITRCRKVNGKIEQSCIDFLITSQDLNQFLVDAFIDSSQLYTLTKFTTSKGIPSVKRSDHHTLGANFSISWEEETETRCEIFKLRDQNGLSKFNSITSKSDKFLKCVNATIPLQDACEKWYKEFDKTIYQCFKKIRITKTPPKSTIDFQLCKLLADIKSIREMIPLVTQMCKPVLLVEIAEYEKAVAEIQGEKCRKIVEDEARKLVSDDFVFNPNAAWALKKKIYPKCTEAPFAVLNKDGQLLTDANGILDVMKEEFTFRLRNREIDSRYEDVKQLKEYLCQLRLEITKNSDFFPWELSDLERAISRLKNNKCRDPHGHINELYKNLGKNGLLSLLALLNRIKEEVLIPDLLRISNVSILYKGKGSKHDVINLRGIFKLPIVRNILDKLIYIDDQKVLNQNMGQFQVGNQQGRSIRDHTFIVHAVINEAKVKKIPIDILFTDIKQCFDSIWLEEALNDLYCSGITSRNLNLLFEGNKETDMCIETSLGRSNRVKLQKVVMQGSVSGGTICSNQIAKLCNISYSEGNTYMYADKVPIPALAMVDDVVNIAKCNSVEGIRSNITTDEFIKGKKMESQVGEGKCQWVHSGHTPCRSSYHANGSSISQCLKYKYLGDTVSDEWENLYKKRYEQAVSYSISCQALCTELSFGFQLYSIAKLVHQAIFLNGTMVNMETWPNCHINRLEAFEKAEQSFLRKVLVAHSKTPIECLYLELGIIPFRFHLMARRIMYYQTIMMRADDEITKKVVLCQKENGLPGDFYSHVYHDMIYLNISEEEVISDSNMVIKSKIKKAIADVAFEYLMKIASTHTKVRRELYSNMEGMMYMKDPRFTPNIVNLLFKFRTRMFNVRNNFRNHYYQTNIMCPLCKEEEDSQEHLFKCISIRSKLQYDISNIVYEDIFSTDVDKLLEVGFLLKDLTEIRSDLESKIECTKATRTGNNGNT